MKREGDKHNTSLKKNGEKGVPIFRNICQSYVGVFYGLERINLFEERC
jgi:hypothetical protein